MSLKRTILGELETKTIQEVADEKGITIQALKHRIHKEVFASKRYGIDSDREITFDKIKVEKAIGAWMESQERRALINQKKKVI